MIEEEVKMFTFSELDIDKNKYKPNEPLQSNLIAAKPRTILKKPIAQSKYVNSKQMMSKIDF
jgi:hypothetical protein